MDVVRSMVLVLAAGLAARAETDLDRQVLESEAWRRGDYVGLLEEWLDFAAAHPEAPQVEVILRAWKNVEVFVPDPTAFLPRLRALEETLKGANGFHLRRNVARLLDETGNDAAAREVRALDGDLTHWRIAGPFGRTDAACFETAFAPERGGPCAWRAYPGASPVTPSRYLRPIRGASYALCQVRAEVETDAFLWIECGGSLRVWWNDGTLPDIDRFRKWLPMTLVAPVHLAAGWNRVLVKSLMMEEGFRVRLLDAHGDPLRLVEEEGEQLHPCGPPSHGATWSTWGALATYEANNKDESGWAASMRAFLLSEEMVPDRALAAGMKSVEMLPDSPHVACLLGELYDTAEHLPESERRNRAKDWYEKALAIDPSFVPAHEDLALYYERDRHTDKALDALRRASEVNPAHFAGPLLTARILEDERWGIESIHALEELDRRAPGTVAAAEGVAMQAVVLGNYPEARRRFEALSARSSSARRQRAELLKAMGDLQGVIADRRAAAERDPSDPAALAALAEALADAGRVEEATDLYRRAWDLVPGESSHPRRIGELFVRYGRDKEGIQYLEKAIEVHPSDGAALALLAELRGEPEEAPEPYRLDVTEAMRDAPPPIGTAVDHLFRQIVIRFRADGSATVWTHQALRLNTQEAVETGSTVSFDGVILEARNHRPDGRVLYPSQIGRDGTITMPGLVAGSVVETSFRREVSPAAEGLSMRFFFHDVERNGPVRYVRLAIEWPESLGLEIRERHFEGFDARVVGSKPPKGWKAAVWEARGLPMLERQSKSPPDTDLLPHVLVAERRTWAEVVETMRESVLGRTRVTEEIRRIAESIAEKAGGRREAVEAAYRFVQTWVKDTESFGDSQAILSTRSGSILTLSAALLDAMGIESEWAAVRPREDLAGEAVWDVPRAEVFSSGRMALLLRVPVGDDVVWLSGDARLLGVGQLSDLAHGGDALILDPRQPRFTTVPAVPASALANSSHVEASLDGDGTLAGSLRLELRGVGAAKYKDRLLGVEKPQRKVIFQTLLAGSFLGLQIEEMDLPGLGTAGTPLALQATFRTPSFARVRGDRMEVPSPTPPTRLMSNFCVERERTVPLRIASWEVARDEAVIRIPAGWRVARLPEDVLLQSDFGRLSMTWRIEGDAVRVRHEVEIRPQVLAPERYPALVKFCRDGDAAEEQRMELAR